MDLVRPGEPSAAFWNRLYASGGTSGTGSVGRLAEFKAETVNTIVCRYRVDTVVDLGCGDGQQLARFKCRHYVGLDASDHVINRCRTQFAGDGTKQFMLYQPEPGGDPLPGAELALSLDVLYHLLEDDVFDRYMSDLFAIPSRLVLIYSSNCEDPSLWDEVRHRRFTDWVAHRQPHWRLVERIPQRYPYVEGHHDTSWCDFFLYERRTFRSGVRSGLLRRR